MAAMSDRLSRAIPFNPLKPFDRHEFADLVATRCCAAAHFAPSTASITRSRKSCDYGFGIPAGLRQSQQLNFVISPISGIPAPISTQAQRALGLDRGSNAAGPFAAGEMRRASAALAPHDQRPYKANSLALSGPPCRSVAQPGSAHRSARWGRRFESSLTPTIFWSNVLIFL